MTTVLFNKALPVLNPNESYYVLLKVKHWVRLFWDVTEPTHTSLNKLYMSLFKLLTASYSNINYSHKYVLQYWKHLWLCHPKYNFYKYRMEPMGPHEKRKYSKSDQILKVNTNTLSPKLGNAKPYCTEITLKHLHI